jgi:hypothetical protein
MLWSIKTKAVNKKKESEREKSEYEMNYEQS